MRLHGSLFVARFKGGRARVVSRDYFIHPARMYGLAVLKLLDALVLRYYEGKGRTEHGDALAIRQRYFFCTRYIYVSATPVHFHRNLPLCSALR